MTLVINQFGDWKIAHISEGGSWCGCSIPPRYYWYGHRMCLVQGLSHEFNNIITASSEETADLWERLRGSLFYLITHHMHTISPLNNKLTFNFLS